MLRTKKKRDPVDQQQLLRLMHGQPNALEQALGLHPKKYRTQRELAEDLGCSISQLRRAISLLTASTETKTPTNRGTPILRMHKLFRMILRLIYQYCVTSKAIECDCDDRGNPIS